MRIHAIKTLKSFWVKYPDAEKGLRYWHGKIEAGKCQTPLEIISSFKDSDYVGNERIVFNIARNKYRLIVAFNCEYQTCFVKFIGTHKEYDKIDARTIEFNA